MIHRPVRVYADTSVFGGMFDVEFADASKIFFEQMRIARFALVVSTVIERELETAPVNVQELFEEMLVLAERVEIVEEATRLARGYLDDGYANIAIHTPAEVIEDEGQDV